MERQGGDAPSAARRHMVQAIHWPARRDSRVSNVRAFAATYAVGSGRAGPVLGLAAAMSMALSSTGATAQTEESARQPAPAAQNQADTIVVLGRRQAATR